MKIGNYNIRAFCVTVQEMPERWEFISKHFKDVGFECEPFNGISAEASGLRTTHPYERDAPGSGWNIGKRPVACWLSFYMLWSALNLLDDEYFLTVEWDCKMPTYWKQRTEDALRDVPRDFDMLLLGSCCCKDRPTTHVAGNVYEVKYPQCGHATIIAKKALPTILATQRKVYAPLDISLMLHTMPLLKVYTVLPRIADQFDTQLPQ